MYGCLLDVLDIVVEGTHERCPFCDSVRVKHVSLVCSELQNLLYDCITDIVDLFGASCHSLEIISKDGEELFLDDTGLSDIFQNTGHMPRLGKDVSNSREVPSSDRCLALNVHLSLSELIDPLLKALDALIDVLDRFI